MVAARSVVVRHSDLEIGLSVNGHKFRSGAFIAARSRDQLRLLLVVEAGIIAVIVVDRIQIGHKNADRAVILIGGEGVENAALLHEIRAGIIRLGEHGRFAFQRNHRTLRHLHGKAVLLDEHRRKLVRAEIAA